MRYATRTLALCLCAAMAATALSSPARSADTDNDWFAAIPGAPANTYFYDVAWSNDGKLACFVGYTSVGPAGVIYFYEPAGDVWTKATMAGGGDIYSYPMKTVTYCPNSWDGPKFFVAGGPGGAGYVYWVAGPGADVQKSHPRNIYTPPGGGVVI